MKNIYVDKAEVKDLIDVYKWRNNLISRRMFNNHLRIKYFKHKLWFFNSLRNKDVFITICKKNEDGFIKLGVVRFNYVKIKKSAEVSINISPHMRGKGLGLICLKKSISLFKKNFIYCKSLTAFVKSKNIPSYKIFKNSGFEVVKKRSPLILFILRF